MNRCKNIFSAPFFRSLSYILGYFCRCQCHHSKDMPWKIFVDQIMFNSLQIHHKNDRRSNLLWHNVSGNMCHKPYMKAFVNSLTSAYRVIISRKITKTNLEMVKFYRSMNKTVLTNVQMSYLIFSYLLFVYSNLFWHSKR